jgi:sugar O-acyltransferase (sialic acid O-acetyltransferase NeuD family)
VKQPVLIYGAGLLGRQLYRNVAGWDRETEILGFIDDVKAAGTDVSDGLKAVGGLEALAAQPAFAPSRVQLIPAIGYRDLPARRAAYERALARGYTLRGFRHPDALIDPSAQLDGSAIILAGAIVDIETRIGPFCYLDIGTRVGEWSQIAANCHLSAGAAIGGSVKVGADCFIGMDASVVNDITIGSHVFINACTLVHQSIPDNSRILEARKSRIVPIDTFEE